MTVRGQCREGYAAAPCIATAVSSTERSRSATSGDWWATMSSSARAVAAKSSRYVANVRGPTHGRVLGHVGDRTSLRRDEERVDLFVAVVRRRRRSGDHPAHAGASHGLELLSGVRAVLGGDHVRAGDDVGLGELVRGLELAPVQRDGLIQRVRREVGGEGVGEAEGCGQLGTEQRRAEDVERHIGPGAGDGLDSGDPGLTRQIALELQDVAREVVGRHRVASQRAHGVLVAARRAAEAQVDATGVERLQGAELLSDRERGVVREHDTAGTEPDGGGVGSDVPDQHARGRRGNGGHVVVLGVPDPPIARPLGDLGERDTRGEALLCRPVGSDRSEIEDREWNGHVGPILVGAGTGSACGYDTWLTSKRGGDIPMDGCGDATGKVEVRRKG